LLTSAKAEKRENMIVSSAVEMITPETAKLYLENNQDNRPVRLAVVEKYAADILAGRWQLTHQGILLDARGYLIDGQHRLLAVLKANKPILVLVTRDSRNLSPSDLVVDRGGIRKLWFVSGKSELAHSIASAVSFAARATNVRTPDGELTRIAEIVEEATSFLTVTKRLGVSNQSVRGAAVLAMLANNRSPSYAWEMIRGQYSKLVYKDHSGMWPIVDALEGILIQESQRTSRQGRRIERILMFDYAFTAFAATERNRESTRIVIRDRAALRKKISDIAREVIK
jgi:hypothetical protein